MNIIVAGGSGFLGRAIVQRLVSSGHSVVILTRHPASRAGSPRPGVELQQWDGENPGPWQACVDGADAVINLAGESIAGGRWTEDRKRRLRQSRISATRALVRAIRGSVRRPGLFLSASAVGYYGDVPEAEVTESHPPATGFLGTLSREWEAEAMAAQDGRTRVALIRTGIVLGRGGGALARMVLPFRLFLGGPLGSGRQYVPWIHIDDVTGGMLHILGTPGLVGPFNFAAPHPVRMSEFARELGRALGRPSWAVVPAPLLRLIMGEMAVVVLSGQKAVPARLLESGYTFEHQEVRSALRDILA
jgi:hypothetical protein